MSERHGRHGHHEARDIGFTDEGEPTPIVEFDYEQLDSITDFQEFDLEQERPKALKRARFLEREDVIRALARSAKGRCGRRGLPGAVVEQMFRDYNRLGSLAKVGRLYGRTRQSMYIIFAREKLPLRSRNFHARIIFGGRAWTPGKSGYYRPTTGDRTEKLHHEIWKARSGRAVPAGWEVTFRNGDNTDFGFGNLVCAPGREVRLLHFGRRFPERRGMSPEQRREFWRTHGRLYMRRKMAAFVAQGLRSDGKPRAASRPQRRAA